MTAIRGAIVWAVTAILLAHAAGYAQPAKGAIRGRVLDSNGIPVKNLRVAALELPDAKGLSSSELVSVGTTDAEGRYLLADVPPGRYGVFTNIRSAYYLPTQDLKSAPTVTVRAGKDSVHDISLPTPLPKFNVSGRMHRVPGSKDVEISLSTENSFLRSKVAVDGTFVFRNVSAGTYRMWVSLPGFAWGLKEVRVEDRDVTGIELFPDDSIPVTGRVTTDGKGPVPTFSFSLEGSKGSTLTSYMWVTDTLRSGGGVGVTGWTDRPDDVIFNASLPIGEYHIAVTGMPTGYRVKSFTYGTTNLLENPLKLTGAIEELSIVLSPPENLRLVRISGRLIRDVSLRPELESDRFILDNRQLLIPLETVIAPNGSFEFSGVPPGIYHVDTPRIGLRLAVGNADVRGIELRTSEIQSRWDAAVRALSNPPEPSVDAVDEIQTAVTPVPLETADPNPVKRFRVSGRVAGAGDAVNVEANEVVLEGEARFTADLDSDGRFGFPAVPSGLYSIFINAIGRMPTWESYNSSVVVQNEDLEGIEVRGLPPKQAITGRIVVEGDYPLPPVSLTIRPNVDRGPPFVHPYTVSKARSESHQFVMRDDGRFTVALPEGLHRLRVDGYSSYQLKSVTYGSANLKEGLLKIDSANPKELVLTFSPVRAAFASAVRGKVEGVANVSGKVEGVANGGPGIRVMLSGNRTGFRLEAFPNADGTFEFAKVPIDTYEVRFMPNVTGTSSKTIAVTGRGDVSVNLSIPARRNVAVRFATADGTRIPNMSLNLKLGQTDEYTILLFARIAIRRFGSSEGVVGAPSVVSASNSEGRYTLRMPEGEYRVDVPAPSGYEVTSIVAGETDLLQAPLRVGPGVLPEIVVTLRPK